MSRHFDQAEGLCEQPDTQTDAFVFNQTMMRIKEPRRTLDFYTRVLGMRLLRKLEFPAMEFTLYFLAMVPEQRVREVPSADAARTEYTFGREAVLELTHNWGDEDDPSVSYHSGNEEPKGFGHIGFGVPDVDAACARFEEQGVEFVKRPNDGKMKGIAFIKDPDGYWIEIFQADRMGSL
ncbi:lactoylglutathione lyase [Aquisalimonas sp. APHAB1-3]|uniref:lactoylglutathione lyase n=4 Tax=unclassified Aquisalimonas TaxID=2644645 RepID=UPI003AAC5F0E